MKAVLLLLLLGLLAAPAGAGRVRRSALKPLAQLRGGADAEQSAEAALRFTRGCLVGVESNKSLLSMALPPFRILMRFFGTHGARARRRGPAAQSV
jgi:hypothetical protein